MRTILLFLTSVVIHAQAWLNLGTPRTVYVKHKTAHALVGLTVYELGYLAGYPRVGLGIVLALGIAKELYDRHNGGSFRAGDVAWTIAPAAVVYLIRF